ncbi:MAG TPA: DUF6596 domain-containing protein [Gemmatimonadaceae bacterium]|nr:DUF6596 domain-containing protein [Gemmatimonadaceae bacterium]
MAARTSYGRLVALLAARTRDVAAAEDALADAFLRALTIWPTSGVPDNPDAWLIATAQRRLIDAGRRNTVRERAEPELAYAASLSRDGDASGGLPDRRLALLFACAHPAIDPLVRTPLMLQVVLGLDAEQIAGAFLTAPVSMAQRLVRAKRKIRDAAIPFEVPAADELSSRLEAVLEAIYAAFGTGWDAVDGSDPVRADLTHEALFLGRLVTAALPESAEARGLLALMLYCSARAAARRDEAGAYVPLAEQATARWDHAMIGEAEAQLQAAAALHAPGRFQLEAAIQSAHLGRSMGRAAHPAVIVALYDALLRHAPTVAALVNRAAAIAVASGAAAGIAAADAIPHGVVETYQPWWALRAHLLEQLGRDAEARSARVHAAGLTQDPAVRAFLLRDGA